MMAKRGKWTIVHPTDVMTMVPVWQCSNCNGIVDGYYPDKICLHCGSENEQDKGKSVELCLAKMKGWFSNE